MTDRLGYYNLYAEDDKLIGSNIVAVSEVYVDKPFGLYNDQVHVSNNIMSHIKQIKIDDFTSILLSYTL